MRVLSVGAAVPETVIDNTVLEERLSLPAGWIERRTGILARPIADSSQAASDLAVLAGERALLAAADPPEIGLLLLATSTPDHLLPPTAPLVAHRLKLANAGAVDLAGACSGFLYGLVLGAAWADVSGKSVLIVGANILSRRVNPADPATVALFSDGAGAILIGPSSDPGGNHLLGSFLGADGSAYDTIGIPAGGSREPLTAAALAEGRNLMTMRRGPALFKQAVQSMAAAGEAALRNAGMTAEAIDWWAPHQANARIIEDVGIRLRIPKERTVSIVARYGNSSAASIPIALATAVYAGQIRRNHVLLLTAAGAGMISAGAVLRW